MGLSAAQAANLSDVYRDAQAYDAQYAAARAAREAGQEKSVQGRAALLPQVGLSGNVARNHVDSSLPGGDVDYTGNGVAINATQPLFRRQNWVAFEQAQNQTKIPKEIIWPSKVRFMFMTVGLPRR